MSKKQPIFFFQKCNFPEKKVTFSQKSFFYGHLFCFFANVHLTQQKVPRAKLFPHVSSHQKFPNICKFRPSGEILTNLVTLLCDCCRRRSSHQSIVKRCRSKQNDRNVANLKNAFHFIIQAIFWSLRLYSRNLQS